MAFQDMELGWELRVIPRRLQSELVCVSWCRLGNWSALSRETTNHMDHPIPLAPGTLQNLIPREHAHCTLEFFQPVVWPCWMLHAPPQGCFFNVVRYRYKSQRRNLFCTIQEKSSYLQGSFTGNSGMLRRIKFLWVTKTNPTNLKSILNTKIWSPRALLTTGDLFNGSDQLFPCNQEELCPQCMRTRTAFHQRRKKHCEATQTVWLTYCPYPLLLSRQTVQLAVLWSPSCKRHFWCLMTSKSSLLVSVLTFLTISRRLLNSWDPTPRVFHNPLMLGLFLEGWKFVGQHLWLSQSDKSETPLCNISRGAC